MCFYDKSFWDLVCGLDINTITAIMSVLIAATALWVSIRSDKRSENHTKLSAYPRVMGGSFDKNVLIKRSMRHIGFEIANRGNSPAIIKNAVLFFDGKEVLRNDGHAYIDFIREKTQNFEDVKLGFFLPDGVIGIGEEKVMWELKYDTELDNIDDIIKLDILIEYESIYHDKIFVYDSRDDFETHNVKSK